MYDTVLYQTCFSLLPLLLAYIFYQTSLPAISDKVKSTLEGLQLGVQIAFGSKTVHTPSSCPRPFFMFSTLNTESSLAVSSRIVRSSPGVLQLGCRKPFTPSKMSHPNWIIITWHTTKKTQKVHWLQISTFPYPCTLRHCSAQLHFLRFCAKVPSVQSPVTSFDQTISPPEPAGPSFKAS